MKALASIILLTFISSQALSLDLPTGDYQYIDTKVLSTKHVHRLYQNSSKDSLLISEYRSKGYLCKRQNSHFTDCSKVISPNPNNLDFKSEKLALLAPFFSEDIQRVSELSSGESVTVYEVEQDYSTDTVKSLIYKAYDLEKHGFYVDLQKQKSGLVRFEYLNPKTLTSFSFQKEKLSKKEYYKHGLLSVYTKQ